MGIWLRSGRCGQPLHRPATVSGHAASPARHRPRRRPGPRSARLGGRGPEGSHVQLRHPTRGGRVTVPLHAGETLGPRLVASILAQAGLTAEELREVL
ncbi:MAG: type II toxin-antitoxin system HicA family toxin [Candidatus Dormibacteria bacterium]